VLASELDCGATLEELSTAASVLLLLVAFALAESNLAAIRSLLRMIGVVELNLIFNLGRLEDA